MNSKKLAWHRENGRLLHPKFTRLATIGDKREEDKILSEKTYIDGYWSSDFKGLKVISKANLGTVVYFHIKTVNIEVNTELVLKLFEDDGLLLPSDSKFPSISMEKSTKRESITSKEIIKKVRINKNGKAVVKLELKEDWATLIDEDWGLEIELFWIVYERKNYFLGHRLNNKLDVEFSKRHLFFKPAYLNYNLPYFLTKEGDTIIFSFIDLAKAELENQFVNYVKEESENYRFALAARVLESGKIISNIGSIHERKKAIYTYDVYTNDGKKIRLKKGSNFGFKKKYSKNGKIITTKGISQIDYFSNIGLKNKALKITTELATIWDITDFAKVFFQDDLSQIPSAYLGNPLSFAFALISELIIKPTVLNIKEDWNKGLEDDFEMIHKPNGLEACKTFADNKNINSPIKYVDVFTPTLQKLLKNEFMSFDEMNKYNQKLQLQGENSNNKSIHTVFYKVEKNKFGLNDDFFIDSIFISDNILNNRL